MTTSEMAQIHSMFFLKYLDMCMFMWVYTWWHACGCQRTTCYFRFPYCLRYGLLVTVATYSVLTGLHASQDSPVSPNPLSIGVKGLNIKLAIPEIIFSGYCWEQKKRQLVVFYTQQIHVHFVWVLEIQSQILRLALKMLYILFTYVIFP